MTHAVLIEDALTGDLLDLRYYCSDSCAQDDVAYSGWNGCIELMFGQVCEREGCESILHGVSECACSDASCVGSLIDV
jgi:hypothetical protein